MAGEEFAKKLKVANLSLTHLWTLYCKELSLFDKNDKSVFQTSDWSARPLSDDMYNYAAHDSHFLCYIAFKMQEQYSKDKPNWSTEISKLYKEINTKIFEIQYTMR